MKKSIILISSVILAVCAFGKEYYVNPDPDKASNAYDGEAEVFDGAHGPKLTLAGVMSVAKKSGDIVYAAEGVYTNEVMSQVSESYSSKARFVCSRVIVPAGVTLQSAAGAEKTFIIGAPATDESGNPVTENNGCGTNSVRCVKLEANAKLVGFTLSGGRAPRGLKDATNYWNAQGGGIYASDSSLVADCVLSNNVAYNSGNAGVNGSYLRCRVVDNDGVGTGTIDAGRIYDCYVNGNTASNGQIFNPGECVNTTFGTKGTTSIWVQGGARTNICECWNCAFLKGVNSPTRTVYHRCAFSADPGDSYTCDSDCIVLTKAELAALGDGGEPVEGSPLVDAGSNTYHRVALDIPFATDVVGLSRVSNGRIDIGSFEFDWRPVFARTLSPFGAVSVAEASSNVLQVVETDELSLEQGASLMVDMEPVGTPARYRLFAEVLGGGVLTICDGETTVASLTSADERKCIELTREGAVRLVLSYSAEDADDAGARVSEFSNAAHIIFNAPGEGITLDGIDVGTNVCAFGASITFTATRRPVLPLCTGITVDGVLHEFGEAGSLTLTVEGTADRIELASVYTERPSAWYVDANDGDDDNLGLYPANAMKTLAAAMTNVNLKSGDTVWALPGSYGAGQVISSERYSSVNRKIANRALVKSGVTLRSKGGAGVTFIEGANATETDDANKGCGVDSVRCVRLESGACVRGFTVRGGRAPRGPMDETATTFWNAQAGGVYSADSNVFIADCVLSNNVAHNTGNVGNGGTYVRCRVVDNDQLVGSSAVNQGVFYDCYINRNYGSGNYQLRNPIKCVNVTFGNKGSGLYLCYQGYECEFYNSLFLNGANSMDRYSYHRCASAKELPSEYKVMDDDCFALSAEELAVIGDGLTGVAGTRLVDAGSNTYHTADFDFPLDGDLNGVPRVLNGRIDIGAAEYDWRTDYARDIRGKVVVAEATSNVVETAAKNVCLGDGDAVTLVWKDVTESLSPRTFRFAVENGTLTVRLNGESVSRLTTDGEWTYEDGSATDRIEFSFAGEGYADVLKSSSLQGLMMIVR